MEIFPVRPAVPMLMLGLMPGAASAQAVAGDPVQRLNAALLANPSATAVLQQWCDDHGIAGKIRALVDRETIHPASAETISRLQAGPEGRLAYRRLRLMCGDVVLSEAENWYVPARLTAEMNAALAGDTPFGTVIRPLAPARRTLTTELEWRGQGAGEILRHRALVIAGDGKPLAEVVETYQRAMLESER